jgi:NRAMP (natural resistance-associated macrophage protein)-like metal ion transporter
MNNGENKISLKARLALFLAVMGPGIITASVDNDANGIATYSVAGAHYGYGLLWLLPLIAVCLYMVQEMCARMGIVTGKGLASLIRGAYGFRITFFAMIVLIIANLANTVGDFAGVAASLEIFGISRYISVPLAGFFAWYLIVKGTYKTVEKIFLFGCFIYITYVISGFMAKPDWGIALQNIAVPSLQFKKDYIILSIAVIGTTIAPWMQFYQQAAVVDKKLKIKDYFYEKVDIIFGTAVTNIVAFFIIVACASTLFVHNISINTAADAAKSLAPLAGKYASVLFAIGLFNAGLFSVCIIPLSTAYAVCEAFGWEQGVDRTYKQAPEFINIYTGMIVIGGGLILWPKAPLVTIMVMSQAVNGVLLPVIMIFMMLLINDPRVMGKYVNTKLYNWIAWIITGLLVFLSVILVVVSFTG